MADLTESAEAFAKILTEVVNGTVSSGVRFVVTPFQGPTELAWVYPDGSTPAVAIEQLRSMGYSVIR